MVAVSIVGILLAIGVPAMQNFLTGRAVLSQAEELAATLRLARSDALRLSTTVSVCAAADTTAAAPVCGEGDWGEGWLTFIDMNKDGARDTGSDRLLRVQAPLSSIKAISSDTDGYVQFYPNGLPATGTAEFEIQPRLDSTDSAYSTMLRTVLLNSAGRAIVEVGLSGS